MARGGYRKPNNPAPVSGPGSLSKRTDGGPADTQAAKYVSGLSYGEGQELMNIQQSADLAATPGIEQTRMPSMGTASAAATPRTPFGAPTERPEEVITSGIDMGAGPDSSILGYGREESADRQKFASQMEAYRPALMFMASQSTTSPETRNLIRRLFV
jgi:hypothetical protein